MPTLIKFVPNRRFDVADLRVIQSWRQCRRSAGCDDDLGAVPCGWLHRHFFIGAAAPVMISQSSGFFCSLDQSPPAKVCTGMVNLACMIDRERAWLAVL